MLAHGWTFSPLCKGGLTVWVDRTGEPPLHKQVQRDANSKALKAQPPPSWGMPWDHDGDRDGSIPAAGSWTEIQNIALEQLLQLQWTPRCCGSVTDPWGLSGLPAAAGRAQGWPGCSMCPRLCCSSMEVALLQGKAGSWQPAAGRSASHAPRLSPLPRLLLSRKTARPGAW